MWLTLCALFHVFRELFCVDRETAVVFVARDGAEYTMQKNKIRDVHTIGFPLEATVENGEIVSYSYQCHFWMKKMNIIMCSTTVGV